MKTLIIVLKAIMAGFFVIGINIIVPFSGNWGISFLQVHGKLLPIAIAAINVFVGGGISGGFLENNFKTGFQYWGKPIQVDGELNPTYAFAGLIAVIHVWIILSIG